MAPLTSALKKEQKFFGLSSGMAHKQMKRQKGGRGALGERTDLGDILDQGILPHERPYHLKFRWKFCNDWRWHLDQLPRRYTASVLGQAYYPSDIR